MGKLWVFLNANCRNLNIALGLIAVSFLLRHTAIILWVFLGLHLIVNSSRKELFTIIRKLLITGYFISSLLMLG